MSARRVGLPVFWHSARRSSFSMSSRMERSAREASDWRAFGRMADAVHGLFVDAAGLHRLGEGDAHGKGVSACTFSFGHYSPVFHHYRGFACPDFDYFCIEYCADFRQKQFDFYEISIFSMMSAGRGTLVAPSAPCVSRSKLRSPVSLPLGVAPAQYQSTAQLAMFPPAGCPRSDNGADGVAPSSLARGQGIV